MNSSACSPSLLRWMLTANQIGTGTMSLVKKSMIRRREALTAQRAAILLVVRQANRTMYTTEIISQLADHYPNGESISKDCVSLRTFGFLDRLGTGWSNHTVSTKYAANQNGNTLLDKYLATHQNPLQAAQ